MQTTKKEKYSRVLLGLAAVLAVTVVAGLVWAGDLEPNAAPGPTFKTLDEIPGTWSRALPADDGDPVTGCDSSRFECVMEVGGVAQAVLDKETGLVWETLRLAGRVNWQTALDICANRTTGGRRGWRLPSVHELTSLVDVVNTNPALPTGHPFGVVASQPFWSATAYSAASSDAWGVHFGFGLAGNARTSEILNIWCVRGAASPSRY